MKEINLYLVLSSEYNKNKDIIEIARQAIKGGADIIQMREKNISNFEKTELGHKLCALCRQNNVLFIVNDDPYLAKRVCADGVHLGQTDLAEYPVEKVREIVGEDKIIGISTHNLEQFKNAHAMDCDYLAYGPIFKTQTKAYHIGMDGITDILAIAAKPVVFIGGINMKNIDHVLAEGAKNIAMIRAIMQADDIEGITRQYKQEIIKRQV